MHSYRHRVEIFRLYRILLRYKISKGSERSVEHNSSLIKPERNSHFFPLENNYNARTREKNSNLLSSREFHGDRGSTISTAGWNSKGDSDPVRFPSAPTRLASRVPELSNARVNAFRGEESPSPALRAQPFKNDGGPVVPRRAVRTKKVWHGDTKLPLSLQDSRFPALHNSPLDD